MKTTIITKKTGAGHYQVTVFQDHNELGTFETNDMQLIDDIQEVQQDGFEQHLEMHETFEDVITTCIKNVNIAKMDIEQPFRHSKEDRHFTKWDGTQIR